MKRAVYDKQFKMAAVKLAQTEDKSVLNTAKGLGISPSSLRRWINEYDEYGESAFPGHGNALIFVILLINFMQCVIGTLELNGLKFNLYHLCVYYPEHG